ncbi:MAG: dTDP-4-amino-4,6-dideoxygalactose transaminase [Thiotrichaceae bacterium]|nr:dTDP-4-amino-4,6-dideoxygalactose transaminase [Thiotrichaceae bacterium]
MTIPFNKPYLTGKETEYITQAYAHLSGDGVFTKRCHLWLETQTQAHKVLLTHSCTAALEMAALLLDIQQGDEVIMPAYTFVSTANAFVLRGAVPVFIDIRPDTLNMDENQIIAAITPKTKAIVPVHYAGVACEMDAILAIAKTYNLAVIEDAAQGFLSKYKGRALGSLGDLGAYSFHETKNIIAGEAGALLVNNPKFAANAEVIREKGTNRSQFFRGEVDKYTWQQVGSSFLPNDLTAAFLYAQLEQSSLITTQRMSIWQRYHRKFFPLEEAGYLKRPVIPEECEHNAHIYYLVLKDAQARHELLAYLKQRGIQAAFHYIPLHTSPAGMRYGRVSGELDNTERLAECMLRLPLWVGLTREMQSEVVQAIETFFE